MSITTINAHSVVSVDVSVRPLDSFDVLYVSAKQEDGSTVELACFGGRWRVARQTIHVTSDEEIQAMLHDAEIANEPDRRWEEQDRLDQERAPLGWTNHD